MTWPEAFSPQAVRDVEEAVDWVVDQGGGPDVARRMALAVVEAAALVARRPKLGHRRPDLLPQRFRFGQVRAFPYLLVYDADRSPTVILRILHMARDLAPLLVDLATLPDDGALPG